jgi:hypothetical protein
MKMKIWLWLTAHAAVGILETYQSVCCQHGGNMTLSYDARGLLPDLQQRIVFSRAAAVCYFECIRRFLKLYFSLCYETITEASDASSSAKGYSEMEES